MTCGNCTRECNNPASAHSYVLYVAFSSHIEIPTYLVIHVVYRKRQKFRGTNVLQFSRIFDKTLKFSWVIALLEYNIRVVGNDKSKNVKVLPTF